MKILTIKTSKRMPKKKPSMVFIVAPKSQITMPQGFNKSDSLYLHVTYFNHGDKPIFLSIE